MNAKHSARLRLSAASGASLIALAAWSAAHAQSQAPASSAAPISSDAPSATSSAQEVVVTGTHIRAPNLVSASPLTSVTNKEFRLEGTTNVETLLNNLPQVTADENENVSNGSPGTANINLRGLGSQRTLVLVDGRRLMPGDPNSPAADVNFIPAALVDRVDLVTGGASAVYGSDAVAGVVNFIMKKDFNGAQIDAQYGFADHDNTNSLARQTLTTANYTLPASNVVDGFTYDVSAILGVSAPDGRGNVTAYLTYRNLQPVTQSTRDYSACAIATTGADNNGFKCSGSSNTPYGKIIPLSGPNAGAAYANNPDGSSTFVPYTSALAYNYAPSNYIQRQDERYTGGFFAHYQVNPKADVYTSLMYMDDHTYSQAAPSGYFQGTTYTINCDNPFLSTQQANLLCGSAAGTSQTENAFIGYRFTGPGSSPRRDDLRHTDYRMVLGAKGDLSDAWSYDTYIQYSKSLLSESYLNNVELTKSQNAVDVVNVNGVPTCESVVNGTDANCVPANIFKYNGPSAAAYKYLYAPSFTSGSTTEQVASADLSGQLGRYGIISPFATHGVNVALGTQYRRENLVYNVDAINIENGVNPSQGTYDVYELYGEVEAPLISDKPFVKLLSIDGGYRFSNYSSVGTTSTYKGELQYAPTPDLRLRGSYNRAVRAPNIQELYAAQAVGNVGLQDPCSGPSPTASLAACERTGVTAAEYGKIVECPSAVCDQLGGGNPNLKPEKADTLTGGVIFTPRALRNFSLSIDYFNIKVNNLIGTAGASVIVSQCIETGSPYFCGLFHRDPRSGVLFGTQGYVVATNINTGYEQTSGLDVASDYSFRLADLAFGRFAGANWGRMDLNLVATWTNSLKYEPLPGLGTYNCAGLFGPTCGEPTPAWRSKARATWSMPWAPVSLSVNWRYLQEVTLDRTSANSFLAGDPSSGINSHIPSYNYVDLAVTWKVKDGLLLRAGVNNVGDKDPPIIDASNYGLLGAFGNGNTYPGVYDPLGRTVFVGLTADF